MKHSSLKGIWSDSRSRSRGKRLDRWWNCYSIHPCCASAISFIIEKLDPKLLRTRKDTGAWQIKKNDHSIGLGLGVITNPLVLGDGSRCDGIFFTARHVMHCGAGMTGITRGYPPQLWCALGNHMRGIWRHSCRWAQLAPWFIRHRVAMVRPRQTGWW